MQDFQLDCKAPSYRLSRQREQSFQILAGETSGMSVSLVSMFGVVARSREARDIVAATATVKVKAEVTVVGR